jgi:predicted AAA+ superfamily ATPase
LQIGSEDSYNELANTLRVSKETISHYIELLEKSFVIFRLAPFNRNLRNELSKMRKIYFYDLGIRNASIRNFNPLHLRADVGALWENFLICERLKNNTNSRTFLNSYFWRTHQQQEIDYLEEAGGKLSAFEFKWKPGIWKLPNAFSSAYPDSTGSEVNPKNFMEFLGI